MQELILKVAKRTPKDRVDGVKGVVYGKKHASQPVLADELEVERLYQVAGNNRLFDLFIEGEKEPVKVLFQDIQLHPTSHHIVHFDLNAVSLKEKIHAEVPVHIEGDAPAVVTHAGIMATVTDTVEVEAEPLNLPERFDIDISNLSAVGDHITVGDLKTTEGVEIITDPEIVLVKIDAIVEDQGEEEEAPQEGEGEAAEGETEEGKESEGAETKEGEAEIPEESPKEE